LEPAGCDGGVPVEFAVDVPRALGAGELAEGAGGARGAPAGTDGGGVDALGGGGGVLGVVVAGGGAEAELAGGGGDATVGALGAGEDAAGGGGGVERGGDGDAGGGAVGVAGGGTVGVVGAPLPPVPLRPAARTMTMSFSLARQLASTPLMKKSAPARSSVTTVSPSSNFFTYDDVLQAL
jgi:hypothetical protein